MACKNIHGSFCRPITRHLRRHDDNLHTVAEYRPAVDPKLDSQRRGEGTKGLSAKLLLHSFDEDSSLEGIFSANTPPAERVDLTFTRTSPNG